MKGRILRLLALSVLPPIVTLMAAEPTDRPNILLITADDPLVDAACCKRWSAVARQWAESAPRLDRGPYPDVAKVPPGGLKLLE